MFEREKEKKKKKKKKKGGFYKSLCVIQKKKEAKISAWLEGLCSSFVHSKRSQFTIQFCTHSIQIYTINSILQKVLAHLFWFFELINYNLLKKQNNSWDSELLEDVAINDYETKLWIIEWFCLRWWMTVLFWEDLIVLDFND